MTWIIYNDGNLHFVSNVVKYRLQGVQNVSKEGFENYVYSDLCVA